MKKYLKIKEGKIFKNLGTQKINNTNFIICGSGIPLCVFYEKNDVDKQADTIEELCDVLVMIQPKHSPRVWNDYSVKECLEHWRNKFIRDVKDHYTYYGANWTYTGLVYVAKLNEEGEFELL